MLLDSYSGVLDSNVNKIFIYYLFDPHCDSDLSIVGELDRIVDKIDQNLLEPLRVCAAFYWYIVLKFSGQVDLFVVCHEL